MKSRRDDLFIERRPTKPPIFCFFSGAGQHDWAGPSVLAEALVNAALRPVDFEAHVVPVDELRRRLLDRSRLQISGERSLPSTGRVSWENVAARVGARERT